MISCGVSCFHTGVLSLRDWAQKHSSAGFSSTSHRRGSHHPFPSDPSSSHRPSTHTWSQAELKDTNMQQKTPLQWGCIRVQNTIMWILSAAAPPLRIILFLGVDYRNRRRTDSNGTIMKNFTNVELNPILTRAWWHSVNSATNKYKTLLRNSVQLRIQTVAVTKPSLLVFWQLWLVLYFSTTVPTHWVIFPKKVDDVGGGSPHRWKDLVGWITSESSCQENLYQKNK